MSLGNLWQQSVAILPELILIGGILIFLVVDLIKKGNQKERELFLSMVAFAIYVIGLAVLLFNDKSIAGYVFSGQIHADGIGQFVRGILLVTGIIAVLISLSNPELVRFLPGEYQIMLMGSIVGGMFLSMANNIVMVYLAIEFVSLLSYLLTAVKIRDGKAYEGAVKYLLFGAVSSGILLFGFSFIYGISGNMSLKEIGKAIAVVHDPLQITMLLVSFLMVFGGLAYKIAVAPFHFWCPDVYEGAATPVTTFFSIAPKVAGFAMLVRLFLEMFPHKVAVATGFPTDKLLLLLAIASALTMTIGNMAAINQQNVKRLLAYSSIAHAGYVLAGFAAYAEIANKAVLFYLFAYLIMNSGAFLVLMVVGTNNEQNGGMDLTSFNGLAYRGRSGALWASAMTVFLFSLTGIPPFIGFIGKYYIFTSLIQSQVYWLAVIGVLNTVVSLYYYARIMKAMFFQDKDLAIEKANPLFMPRAYSVLGVVLVLATILMGIFPSWISLP